MMMLNLKCRYVQARIPAYAARELSLETRRFVGRHLDDCPHCQAEYRQQRNAIQHFEREMPRMGQPDALQLEKMWAGIQAGLQPPSVASTPTQAPAITQPDWRYGFVMVAFLLTLLLPMTLNDTANKGGMTLEPVPPVVHVPAQATLSPIMTEPTAIAFAVETGTASGDPTPAIRENTPAPPVGTSAGEASD